MRFKKRKKSERFRGSRLHGRASKKAKGKGHHGGKGMAGTGKKAGHKATFINRYLLPYFGKQGLTSRSSKRDKRDKINVGDIQINLASLESKGLAKKTSQGYEIDLKDYKILGDGDLKEKLIIKAKSFSSQAREKIEKAGGKIVEKKKADA